MKYKNIVFDFGNVIGKFDGHYILRQFCSSEQDLELLFDVIFSGWGELDKGTVDYNENIENVVRRVPARLEDTVRSFFRGWPEHIIPIRQTADFIRELKDRKVPIYLLSANSHFLRPAGPHFPASQGHIKRSALEIGRARGAPPC